LTQFWKCLTHDANENEDPLKAKTAQKGAGGRGACQQALVIILSHVRRCLTNHKYGPGPSPGSVIDGGRWSLDAGRWTLAAKGKNHKRAGNKNENQVSTFFMGAPSLSPASPSRRPPAATTSPHQRLQSF